MQCKYRMGLCEYGMGLCEYSMGLCEYGMGLCEYGMGLCEYGSDSNLNKRSGLHGNLNLRPCCDQHHLCASARGEDRAT